jgi:uncharacterized membrane protein YhhN
MKKTWLILFAAALGAYIAGIQLSNQTIQYISKPLLMPLLAIYFITSVSGIASNLKTWVIAALFFSWAGDVLLMFEEKDKLFFMLGLSAFLFAHIFYIILFHKIRVKEAVKGDPWLMVVVVVYYGALIALLSPFLGEMKWPVRVYGIVISFMFMLAMHMLFIRNKMAGKWMMAGALLFVISDSALAINKFYQPFEGAGIVIIVTYGLAQLFIVQGAVKYIRGVVSGE